MQRILFILLLSLYTLALISQTEEVRYFTTRTYQNESQKKTPFKRTYLPQDGYFIVKSYGDKTLLDSGIYMGFESIENLNSFYRFHVESQSYMRDRTDFTHKEARVTEYFSDGSPKERSHFIADSSAIHQTWTSKGEPILSDGFGVHRVEREDGTTQLINYENYQLIDALSLRPEQGDTIHLRPQKPARPKEGLRAFHSFLAQNLEYPQEAKELGIETTLYVNFVVDKSGKLQEFEVTSSYKPVELTRKTLKKLRKLPDWNPAYHYGKAVKTSYVIPIVFRLE